MAIKGVQCSISKIIAFGMAIMSLLISHFQPYPARDSGAGLWTIEGLPEVDSCCFDHDSPHVWAFGANALGTKVYDSETMG